MAIRYSIVTRVYSTPTLLCRSFFFFQAEDGIRDLIVTGVQTCALPICGVLDDDVVEEPVATDEPAGHDRGQPRLPPARQGDRAELHRDAHEAGLEVVAQIGRASCRERV